VYRHVCHLCESIPIYKYYYLDSSLLTYKLLSSPQLFACTTTDIIEVDTLLPENNREFYVLNFSDVMKEGVLHNGFEISMEIDLRNSIFRDVYKAQLVSSNES
jgi:hypothetical protein